MSFLFWTYMAEVNVYTLHTEPRRRDDSGHAETSVVNVTPQASYHYQCNLRMLDANNQPISA